MRKKRWKERDCNILVLVYNNYMDAETAIEILQRELERSIETMRVTPAEQTVREAYIKARNAFYQALLVQDLDDSASGPFASVIESDEALFQSVREADHREDEAHGEQLEQLRNSRHADGGPKNQNRLPRTIKVPKEIDRLLIKNVQGSVIRLWHEVLMKNPGMKPTKMPILDEVAKLIAFAKAMEANPEALNEMKTAFELQPKDSPEDSFLIDDIKDCLRLLEHFGKELAALAGDRNEGNEERWHDIAQRISMGKTEEIKREFGMADRETQEKRKKK